MVDLIDQHAVVTGGSKGIGRAVAIRLAEAGARVSIVARGRADLDEAAEEIAGRGRHPVLTAAADVADREALDEAFDRLVDEAGPCDVLVTSAGLAHPGRFEELDDHLFRLQMEVNYFGTLHAVRAVVPSMIERRAGSVVGVSSAAGLVGVYGYTAYSPTKFAVRGLMESLRVELAPHGVHVGCVFPPDTDTPGLEYEDAFKPAETRAISGTIKPVEARQVADAVVRGIERERFWIIPDAQTRFLARAAGLFRGTIESVMDRKVRKVRAT